MATASAVLLLATLAAAPVAPATADAALSFANPKEQLPALRTFFAAAGRYSATLQPETLGRTLAGGLSLDLLDAAALHEAGVDVAQPITVSRHPAALLTCFTARDRAVGGRLEVGMAEKKQQAAPGGVALVGAPQGKGFRQGYARKGNA
ncbi:MAG: hypothetical protein ACK4N5_23220, partial [Myxococcales bacterium]